MFQTEFEFTLPKGYIDQNGTMYRQGVMRMANAADEILAMRDPRVKANPEYAKLIILSRVILSLGKEPVTPQIMETLFVSDLNYLQQFYQTINETGRMEREVTCPHCGKSFQISFEDKYM